MGLEGSAEGEVSEWIGSKQEGKEKEQWHWDELEVTAGIGNFSQWRVFLQKPLHKITEGRLFAARAWGSAVRGVGHGTRPIKCRVREFLCERPLCRLHTCWAPRSITAPFNAHRGDIIAATDTSAPGSGASLSDSLSQKYRNISAWRRWFTPRFGCSSTEGYAASSGAVPISPALSLLYFSNRDRSLVKSHFLLVWALAELLQYLWDLSLKDRVCKALASSQILQQSAPQMALVEQEFSTSSVSKWGKKKIIKWDLRVQINNGVLFLALSRHLCSLLPLKLWRIGRRLCEKEEEVEEQSRGWANPLHLV